MRFAQYKTSRRQSRSRMLVSCTDVQCQHSDVRKVDVEKCVTVDSASVESCEMMLSPHRRSSQGDASRQGLSTRSKLQQASLDLTRCWVETP